ncbi:hypothetical protein B0H10DRAFT_2185634 [Mycena sp. CBHHK59/15]|nr:hypothetical protein B0H10DRAFT_2185634 [Mycena sp. CBHHK59/15]
MSTYSVNDYLLDRTNIRDTIPEVLSSVFADKLVMDYTSLFGGEPIPEPCSATGFIGLPAAKALVRAGHTVYGFVRDQAKAKFLAAGESPYLLSPVLMRNDDPDDLQIIPVIGDLDSDVWTKLMPTLDVIIEAIGGGEVKDLSATAFERTTKAVQEMRPKGAPLLSHIYTPGTWVHGDSRKDTVIDTTPIYRPVELVTWRPAMEQAAACSPQINGIVIHPALLYGRSASILAMLFKSASQGGRYAVIHADDLADLYVRAAEKASLIGGKIFDAANPNKEASRIITLLGLPRRESRQVEFNRKRES